MKHSSRLATLMVLIRWGTKGNLFKGNTQVSERIWFRNCNSMQWVFNRNIITFERVCEFYITTNANMITRITQSLGCHIALSSLPYINHPIFELTAILFINMLMFRNEMFHMFINWIIKSKFKQLWQVVYDFQYHFNFLFWKHSIERCWWSFHFHKYFWSYFCSNI